jgi:hypothetical protein
LSVSVDNLAAWAILTYVKGVSMPTWVRLSAGILLVFVVSCGQKESDTPPAAPAAAGTTGTSLTDVAIWTISEANELIWKATSPVGERVQAVDEPARTAYQYEADRTFIKVRRPNGDEGWARQDFVVAATAPGVVRAEKSVLYSAAANTAATANAIPRMSIVAVHGAPDPGDRYWKISVYDPQANRLFAEVYARAEELSMEEDNVQSAILYRLARAASNATQREALLTNAANDHKTSVFAKEISEALSLTTGGPPLMPTFMLSLPVRLVAARDGVNVRAGPDATWSPVVGTLALDQGVEALERSTEEYVIDGQSSPWYRISEPEGWVFGAFLSEVAAGE